MDLIYGTISFDQARGNLMQSPLVNMYVETVPTEKNPVLLSRPGLSAQGLGSEAMGTGPITCLFQMDGVLNGDIFGCSGSNLYRDSFGSSSVGALDGSNLGVIDAFPTRIFINKGASCWTYDGTTLGTVAMPGGFAVTDLCVGADRLIVLKANSGQFYWSDALSTTVNALSFATAEQSADNLFSCLYIGDTLVLFGSKSVEFWPATTDPNSPFAPLIGRTFNIGAKNTRCSTKFFGGFAWITSNNQICFNNPETILSTIAIEEKMKSESTPNLWTFLIDGTEFLACRMPGAQKTYVYSSRSKMWSEFKSNGQSNFIPQCWCRVINASGGFDTHRFGGSDGNIYIFSGDTDPAASSSVMEKTFRAGYPLDGEAMTLDNVQLRMNMGAGTGSITMRTSKDGGQTWGSTQSKTLTSGQFRQRVQWRSQGIFSHPGILCEFSMTNNIPLRISGVTANEKYADVGA